MDEPTASNPRLGQALKEYKRSPRAFLKLSLLSLIPACISGLIFYGAFFGRGVDLGGKIVLVILGSFILLPAIAGVYMLYTRRGSSVSFFEKGFIYRYGKKEFATNWDDIASIAEGVAIRIELIKGETFDMGTNVEGFDEVAQLINEETLQRLLPKAKAAIDRGGTVAFKGIKVGEKNPLAGALNKTFLKAEGFIVDTKGISMAEDDRRIAWSDVVDFGIHQGEGRQARFIYFIIRNANLEFQMNYATLQNGHVLLEICRERAPQANSH